MNYTKALLVGSAGCGKSSWLERFATGQFRQQHVTGPDVWYILFEGRYFEIVESRVIPTDCDCDMMFIMFDMTNPKSYKAAQIHKEVAKQLSKPVVFIGTKEDDKTAMEAGEITIHRGETSPIWLISSKSCYNFDKPFIAAETVL